MLKLDDVEYERVRLALLGDRADELVDCMYRFSLGLMSADEDVPGLSIAQDLGWVDDSGTRPTAQGWFAADSCREYRFWVERDRKLPFDGQCDALHASDFHGKTVLEIGSGMGANLMSLNTLAHSVSGVEPVMAYTQLGRIFREREGLPEPDVRTGTGEAIPYDDASFDVLLCVSAHQYFDIRRALDEMVRVLRPGGELIIIGGVLGKYIPEFARQVLDTPTAAKGGLITIANTLSYTLAGHRIIPARGAGTTSRPVYPTVRAMCRMLEQAGLSVSEKGCVLSNERLFRATKPLA